jgi:hypothetical protein
LTKGHGVVTSNFFGPLWNLWLSGESRSTPSETNDSLEKETPSPIVLISEATLISFQTELKVTVAGELFRSLQAFRNLKLTKTHGRRQRIIPLRDSRTYLWKLKETPLKHLKQMTFRAKVGINMDANLISGQSELRSVVSGQFCRTGTLITTKSMVDYKAV